MTTEVYEREEADFYTARQLARKVNVSHSHICRLARDGNLPFRVVFMGTLPRFPKLEVDEWIKGKS